ncbi:hypothetical protein Gotur_004982 [Gossypium turneri]
MFQGSLSIEEDELDLDSNLEDSDDFDCIDLDFGFYTVKFINPKDRLKVVTEGPWKIMDHFLTFQKWTPNFHIERAKVKSVAVWIHLLGLPLEYFHESILVSVGKLVGKPIKVDTNTALAMRGKFARIYVVVDFGKPLILRVRIENFTQQIEYKGLHRICFLCGHVDHRINSYSMVPRVEVNLSLGTIEGS